ncbi:rhomboid family intramembrane serine protease [Desulfobacca acetoxidans]|uniref:Peptidase S54, rhomboid domain protein n=1 Tax=Desulfobacca acetoxidans (strain ATCC 700848 / DSM 11109 / ASRB2) TaxID=880072 RepID=F2NJN1_DESAR|nr:rhomboid family intramembrane serine protease [Desulfobacca acetoxidans]AEB09686.1 Peptidase S54, rhomboid domain protein [Desulfobacca acetoxidans DSM 11109]HAY22969.1 rhomboid family intramembrane serine protease [Desulfobacterales bacterium]
MVIPIRGLASQNSWAFATIGLISLNFVIFFFQLHIGQEAALKLFWQGGAIPAKLSQVKLFGSGQSLKLAATMFTSLFLHAGWVHLLGNMLFLWVFGEALEGELGHWRFLGFYLFCGFFSLLIHSLAASKLSAPIIGASGAIAGVLGAHLIRFPQAPVQTLVYLLVKVKIIAIPAYVWLGFWLLLQFYGLRQGGPVAWFAHLGGFFTGLLGVFLFLPDASSGRGQKTARRPKNRRRR